MGSATQGVSIRYTTDGSTPTETVGTLYSTPISVEASEIVSAVAYKQGLPDSAVAIAEYSIEVKRVTFDFKPPGGTYSSDQSIAITCDLPGATIHYTIDGSTPSNSSATYSASIAVAGNGTKKTIKAIATAAGLTTSSVGSATYVIDYGSTVVSSPTFAPESGTYASGQSLVISCWTPGSTIHYTMDGSIPTISSPRYTAPIPLTGNEVVKIIKAIAFGSGGDTASSVVTAAFTVYADWQVIGFLGDGTDQFKYPTGVAVDSAGHIYVADRGNSRIVFASAMTGSDWTTFQGSGSSDHPNRLSQLKYPAGIALDASGRIYVADQSNNRIVRMDDIDGTGWTSFGSIGSGTDQFTDPAAITLDAHGRIYVVDQGNSRVVRVNDMNGTGWTAFGERGNGANQFKDPAGIALDAGGRLYVADYNNNRIVRFDDMIGSSWTAFGTPGTGSNHFRNPSGISVDIGGHIFVADMGNNRIVRLDDMSGANWTTVGDAVSLFNLPWGVEVDGAGRIYVSDTLHNRVVRLRMQ